MKRQLKRKWKNIPKNHKLIYLGCLSILVITIAYSVMNQVLKINGYASIDRGDGMIFTNIDVKENTGASLESAPAVKAKTMINTKVSFDTPGSITFIVAAQNQGEYDAKLIEIQKLEQLNNAEPTCIKTSVVNHNIGETVYASAIKTFEVTVTSTCTAYSSKEIEIYFKYNKQKTQGGTLPKAPGNGNAVEYLKNNEVKSNVDVGGSGLVALDNRGEITTSNSPREYRYIGSNPDNYVKFNNELWRIIGIFDGQLKIIRANKLDNTMAWDSNNINDWSKSSLKTYLNGEYLKSIDSISQEYISDYKWKLGGSNSFNDVTAQTFYEKERGNAVYNGRPTEWTGKIALMYPSDYGFATSGGGTTNRSSCLSKSLSSWNDSSVSDCKNNDWLYDSTVWQWFLTSHNQYEISVSYIQSTGYIDGGYANSLLSVYPSQYLKSQVEFNGGYGTENDPYILTMRKPTASDYLINNKVVPTVDTDESGLVAIDNKGEVTTSSSPREYRYIGSNPDNYVDFGGDYWRIIGIFDGQIKMVNVGTMLGIMPYNENYGNTWLGSTLQQYLNEEYLNEYGPEAIEKIDNYNWKVGGPTVYDLTAQGFYEAEDNLYSESQVALFSISDYGFATNGRELGRSTCLSYPLSKWNNYPGCIYSNWLYTEASKSGGSWTLTPDGAYVNAEYFVLNDGHVDADWPTEEFGVLPTVFLKKEVEIIGGTGSESDPYIVE